jgi:hypothetical protein
VWKIDYEVLERDFPHRKTAKGTMTYEHLEHALLKLVVRLSPALDPVPDLPEELNCNRYRVILEVEGTH